MEKFVLESYVDSRWSRRIVVEVEAEDLSEAQHKAMDATQSYIDTGLAEFPSDEGVCLRQLYEPEADVEFEDAWPAADWFEFYHEYEPSPGSS